MTAVEIVSDANGSSRMVGQAHVVRSRGQVSTTFLYDPAYLADGGATHRPGSEPGPRSPVPPWSSASATTPARAPCASGSPGATSSLESPRVFRGSSLCPRSCAPATSWPPTTTPPSPSDDSTSREPRASAGRGPRPRSGSTTAASPSRSSPTPATHGTSWPGRPPPSTCLRRRASARRGTGSPRWATEASSSCGDSTEPALAGVSAASAP